MKWHEEMECEHGWTDNLGMAHCDLGTSCSYGLISYCVKEVCPIYETDDERSEDDTLSEMCDVRARAQACS